MTVTSMTYVRCVLIRDLLSLSAEEAAKHIGENASVREWINWECNKEPVPEYVVKRISDINLKHQRLIKMMAESQDHSSFILSHYMTFEDYQADHPAESYIDWVVAKHVSQFANIEETQQLRR